MNGRFGYRKNCSLIHHIPQREWADGCPVIVFPKRPSDVVEGTLYEFDTMLTRTAKYTIDGKVYRVAHAINLRDTEGKEAGVLDKIVHRHTGSVTAAGTSLGDLLKTALAKKAVGHR